MSVKYPMTRANKEKILTIVEAFIIWQGEEWELSIKHPNNEKVRTTYYGKTIDEAIDACMNDLTLAKLEHPGPATFVLHHELH